MSGRTLGIWKVREIPTFVLRWGLSFVISVPLKEILPSVAGKRPVTTLKKVVFPEPLGPIKLWIVPFLTVISTLLRARIPAKSFTSPSVQRMLISNDVMAYLLSDLLEEITSVTNHQVSVRNGDFTL
jgi:hypothetical protein